MQRARGLELGGSLEDPVTDGSSGGMDNTAHGDSLGLSGSKRITFNWAGWVRAGCARPGFPVSTPVQRS
jgi:hypothetical protein